MFLSVPSLLRVFSIMGIEFCQVFFLHSLTWSYFFLYSVNVLNYTDWFFSMLNQPCIHGLNLIWDHDVLSFLHITGFALLVFSHLYWWGILLCNSPVRYLSVVVQGYADLIKWVWRFSLSPVFRKKFV